MSGKEYRRPIRNCSSCGRMLARGETVISGKEMNQREQKVLFCGPPCQSNYAIENNAILDIESEPVTFGGK